MTGNNDSAPLLDPEKVFTLARDSQGATNGLLLPEHIAYCMGWKQQVNPNSLPITAMYVGIGPDISTILYTADPTVVLGVDMVPISPSKLEEFIESYGGVDTDPIEFKLLGATFTGRPAQSRFKSLLQTRTQDGYWDALPIGMIGIERCIAIELKRLGVDPSTIEVQDREYGNDLSFDWAYPSNDITFRRTFQFLHAADIDILDPHSPKRPDFMERFSIPGIDLYYAKSAISYKVSQTSLALPYVNEKGVVLLGMPFWNTSQVEEKISEYRRKLGKNWFELNLPEAYTHAMLSVHAHQRDSMSYGWQLFGFKRIE